MRHLSPLLFTLLPALAWSAGMEIGQNGARAAARGGAFVAGADDPTAVIHNPGALSRLKGLYFAYNHNLVFAHQAFTRAPSQIPATLLPAEDPLATVENETPFFGLGGFAAATYDFGLERWVFGLSVCGPAGTGHLEFPVTGGQRYLITELDAWLLYYGVSAAYGTDDFGVGLTLQYADLPRLAYSLVVDGQPGGDLNPYASGSDVEATVVLKDRLALSALAGAWWRPTESWELALSGRLWPAHFNATGTFSMKNVPGQANFSPEQLEVTDPSAALDLTLAPTLQLGVRYIQPRYDLELDLTYEAWSFVDKYNIDLEGGVVLLANEPAQDVYLEKNWSDTFAVRLGGSVDLVEDTLEISGGLNYETSAVPTRYTHLDFMSFQRLGISAGLSYQIRSITTTLSYSHLFQEDRDVSETIAKVYQQRPVAQCPGECNGYSGVPANAGHFESSFDIISLGMTLKL